MQEIIKALYPMGATLLGAGYDNALEWINHLIPLDILEFKSGTQIGTWTVPDEWVVRDAWVKYKGKKIIEFDKKLGVVVYSAPFKGTVSKEELEKHLHVSDELPEATPYVFKFYDIDWGLCVPKTKIKKYNPQTKVWDSKLKDGDYEVFIDSEFKPGVMKVGVHTIKGKLDKEILLFAHLDHPYQANDNLSGVACLIDIANKIKTDYTVKIIFCPETIGSTAYALTQDISKVEFVIAVDICGNDAPMLFQKAYDLMHKINFVGHLALQNVGESYQKGVFRAIIGSDEYAFNDPLIGIPGIMLSRYPYKEYHTSADTPDKINYPAIERMQKVILKIIDIYSKDRVPERTYKGPTMRSRFGIQTGFQNLNLSYDYLFYSMDGKKSLARLCSELALNFDHTLEFLNKMADEGFIRWVDAGQER